MINHRLIEFGRKLNMFQPFTLTHIAGVKNVTADVVSRHPVEKPDRTMDGTDTMLTGAGTTTTSTIMDTALTKPCPKEWWGAQICHAIMMGRAKRRTKSRKCVNVSNTLKRPPPPKPMTRQPFHSGLKFRGGDTSATRTFETTLTHSEPEQVNHRVRDLYKEQIPVLQQNFSIGNLVDKYELPMTSSRKNSTSELVIPKDIESIEHPDPEKSKDRLLKEIAIMENLPPMLNNEKQVKKAEEKLVKHSPDWVILSAQPQKDKALGKRLKKLRKGSILVRNRQQEEVVQPKLKKLNNATNDNRK